MTSQYTSLSRTENPSPDTCLQITLSPLSLPGEMLTLETMTASQDLLRMNVTESTRSVSHFPNSCRFLMIITLRGQRREVALATAFYVCISTAAPQIGSSAPPF